MKGESAAPERGGRGLRRSVFWRVAGVLVGVQVATGLLAVLLGAWFAYDRSLALVAGSLRLRLDGLAEEVEQRAAPLAAPLTDLPQTLLLDLGARFPDPVTLVDAEGAALVTVAPEPEVFGDAYRPPPAATALPPGLERLLLQGEIVVALDEEASGGTFGLAPLYDPDGALVGGVLVQPLTVSVARELEGTRAAYRRALVVVAVLSILIALLLGAFFTWRLVQPLRRVTRQVERIGAGDYTVRLAAERDDEFGRLAAAVNTMAEAVAASIESLRATDTVRRELVANVGHDLRTPLAALLGYVEEAERYLGQGQDAAARQALTTAASQGDYLSRLVADLFELSLLDRAALPLRREPIPLAELLADAARAHRAAFDRAGVALVLDLPPALPTLEGDGVRLLRVIDNLLVNARCHTAGKGTVRLGAEVANDSVYIEVQDTGHGMEPDELARVFDRYYRGRDARTRRTQGTGLGLAISRAIARAHGGDLAAESIRGEGSTFTLRLPLEAPGDDPALPEGVT